MHVNVGRRALLFVAIAVTTVVAGAGVAYATGVIASGQGPTIVGCAKKQNGQLRIVTDASQCLTSESAVSFAAPGPPPAPVSVTVDCGAGQTVQQAIDTADPTQPLTVTISGTCNESVGLFRDNVTLQAAASGGGIVSSSGDFPALTVGGRNVSVQGLTLAGTDGSGGLQATSGATVHAQDLHVTGNGVGADENSDLELANVTIDECQGGGIGAMSGGAVVVSGGSVTGCANDVRASSGGSVHLGDGVRVTNARIVGVGASVGGSIVIDSAIISNDGNYGVLADGGSVIVEGPDTLVTGNTFAGVNAANGGTVSIGVGARVSANGTEATNGPGASAISGGHLSIQEGAIVELNIGAGVRLAGASTLSMGGQAVVQNNGGDGVSLSDTSVATFLESTVTGNTGHGIHCDGAPSVAVIRGLTDGVSGNGLSPQVDCQNAGQPG